MSTQIVVVGLSAASIAFITKLRSFDTASVLHCFSAEPAYPYNRCLLADFLTGHAELSDIALKPDTFFQQPNTYFYFDTKVTKLDTEQKLVRVNDASYSYDVLFLGIGTRPMVPQCLDFSAIKGVFTFHTFADMQNIQTFFEHDKPHTAIVVGAGLNGMEAASSLVSKGLSVILVESNPSVLPGQVDKLVAGRIMHMAQKNGITVLAGRRAMGYYVRDGQVAGLTLDTGSVIYGDMVVLAVGSKLNSELVSGTGIAVEQGLIKVDAYGQTSVSGVYAGGDICKVADSLTKELVRSTTWSDAMLQGLCAATALSSTPRPYQGAIGLRGSYFFGIDFYACGQTNGLIGTQVVKKYDPQNLEVWYLQQDHLIGFVLLGDISSVGQLKRLYMTQEKLSN